MNLKMNLKMKSLKLLTLIFIAINFHSFGQYKNFSLGFGAATAIVPKEYTSLNLSLQYNFRRIFSIRTGVESEKTYAVVNNFWDMYPSFNSHLEIQNKYFNIPLNLRASFGKKVLIFTDLGFVASYGTKSKYTKNIDYWDPNISDISVSDKNSFGVKRDIDILCGLGLLIPVNERLNVSFIAKKKLLRDAYFNNVIDHFHYDYSDVIHSFKGVSFSIDIAYQFNFSKKSDYKFSTFSPKITKY